MLPREIVAALHAAGEKLPSKVHSAALKQGRSLVPALRRMVREDKLPRNATGYGEIHALQLLGELGAVEAIEDIVSMLQQSNLDEIRHGKGLYTLIAFGAAALEPLLAAPEGSEDFEGARCEALAELGVRDPRIYERLVAYSEQDPVGYGMLAKYGDQAALPLILAAFDRTPLSEEGAWFSELFELADAVRRLGGELTAEQQARLDLDMQRIERWRQERREQRDRR